MHPSYKQLPDTGLKWAMKPGNIMSQDETSISMSFLSRTLCIVSRKHENQMPLSEFMTECHKRNSHKFYITITCCTSKMPLCSLGVKSTDSDAVQMHIQVDKRQSIHAPAQRITYRKLAFQWLHVLRWHTWTLQRVRSGENIPNWELYWGHLSSKCWFRLVHDFGQNFRKQKSFRVLSVTVIIMRKENLFCTNW